MEKKFIWYGLNKQFNHIGHSHAITTTDLLDGNYPSWMALKNRGKEGNCDFLAECFFTGQKDKNGKEIYEDDIFHCNNVNYVLKYNILGGAYTVHNINDDTDERFLHHCNHQIEVIGNIYENPELLSTPTAVL